MEYKLILVSRGLSSLLEKIDPLSSFVQAPAYYYRYYSDNNYRHYFIFYGQQIIGYTLLSFNETRVNVNVLCLDWKHQRRGHGTKIIHLLIDMFGEKYESIELYVAPNNDLAVRVYLNVGFKFIDNGKCHMRLVL